MVKPLYCSIQIRWRRSLWRWLLIVSLSAIAVVGLHPVLHPSSPGVTVYAADPQSLMQQGREQYAAGQYTAALEQWQQAAQGYAAQEAGANAASALSNQALAHLKLGQYEAAQTTIDTAKGWLSGVSATDYNRRVLAQVLSTEGQLFMAQGDATRALASFAQAIKIYEALDDETGLLRAQLNQAQIFRVQGRIPETLRSLDAVSAQLDELPGESSLKATGYRQLGIALQRSGDISGADTVLRKSLEAAEQRGDAADISAAWLSLGNLAPPTVALDYYRQAAQVAPTTLSRIQAQVNALHLLVDLGFLSEARPLLSEILVQLPDLPPSRSSLFVRINVVSQALKPEAFEASPPLLSTEEIARLLTTTLDEAQAIGDARAETYSLGYLGRLYENNQQWDEAIELTRRASLVSQSIDANVATYQWQWQLGRIFEAQGETEAAIAAFEQALTTLQRLRSDLVAADRDARFSFRQEIEPVYRDLVSLLLKTDAADTPQENIFQARDVIESLQVEELVNFFRADCVVTQSQQIEQIDTESAIIYPIILEDRVEVILGLPGQPLLHQPTDVPRSVVESSLDQLFTAVSTPNFTFPEGGRGIGVRGGSAADYLTLSQQVYDWIIRPFDSDLQASGIDTLVFVLDGKLRNVPMAVLHDGDQYLVEKYAIALTPGLQLLDPHPLADQGVEALVGGLSESREDFAALPFVETELETIEDEVPSQVLLNETFDTETFASQLTDTAFPIVHLATHGQFGATLEQTFILTWDGRINANQLSQLLQNSEIAREGDVELLILSACETATGDDQAALGLAGIAVRSGARSTLATLWQVSDLGTSLWMGDFYSQLADTQQTKAQMIRNAQLNMLATEEYQDPFYWAPFVLVGNWL
ncbi:CHAT domain-containing protein [Oscillatoria sp. CS-180]|uniref:CHAT domain-containing protein n=1 Tax=Oscillatoria sp. CS-180 TaxID=3021720 RepID=UPI0023309D0B|nr:CHAT domain-containing protein [Oscillatoria sp. CS-180]MDB9528837.1 CHAT domain-containing protein [Oscillatoria sp. CS-180]